MGNMSYCRFENTLNDLIDCQEHMDDNEEDMNKEEMDAKKRLIEICKEIADDFGDEE